MFRFTIRDVLWLTVVVGLAVGLGFAWWKDRRALSRDWRNIAHWMAMDWAAEVDHPITYSLPNGETCTVPAPPK
jgi:hypothetical protein